MVPPKSFITLRYIADFCIDLISLGLINQSSQALVQTKTARV